MKKIEEILEYLQRQGVKVSTTYEQVLAEGLPVLYTVKYDYYRCKVALQHFVLALDKGTAPARPAGIARHMEQLKQYYGCEVVYVGGRSVPHLGPRLISRAVAHVIPGRRFWLPFLNMMMTRPEPVLRAYGSRWSKYAQLVILAVLNHRLPTTFSRQDAMSVLHCSRASIQNAVQELEFYMLGHNHHDQGERLYQFTFNFAGRSLWQRALPRMFSPCRRVIGVASIPDSAVVAGADALARFTNLSEQEVSTYAVALRGSACLVADTLPLQVAPYQLQLWVYDPCIFGWQADVLSVCLSLREESDPRVAMALEQVESDFVW